MRSILWMLLSTVPSVFALVCASAVLAFALAVLLLILVLTSGGPA